MNSSRNEDPNAKILNWQVPNALDDIIDVKLNFSDPLLVSFGGL